jgi:peptide/nickel transport system substrate-binding protein
MNSEKTDPTKVKKRYPNKPLIVGGTIIVFAIAGIVGGIVILGEIDKPGGGILVIGVTGTLDSLDPIEGWEVDSSAIITQIVTEALFAVEGIHNGSRLIPNLATRSDWSDNKTELTCYIRKSVEFHDGTPFTATAVKWNIDY